MIFSLIWDLEPWGLVKKTEAKQKLYQHDKDVNNEKGELARITGKLKNFVMF